MDLSEHINAYCERQAPEFYAEPLNAISNLAFFYWAWKLWTEIDPRKPCLKARLRWLAGLIAFVGVGSLAFHTFATGWASVLDVLFIGVFNVSYVIIFLRVVPRWPRHWAFAGGAGFVLLRRRAISQRNGARAFAALARRRKPDLNLRRFSIICQRRADIENVAL